MFMPLPGPPDHGSSPPLTYLLFIVKLSRTGFSDPTKVQKVRIVKGKMSQTIVKEQLSERAVMKEDSSDKCVFKRGILTPKGT